MAYVNQTRAATNPLSGRFKAVVNSVKASLARRRVYHVTLRELNALSDRELADLGVHRMSIPEIATEAAYGR
jgi:uncharacterized protein YjiS (DUF1127 family)